MLQRQENKYITRLNAVNRKDTNAPHKNYFSSKIKQIIHEEITS